MIGISEVAIRENEIAEEIKRNNSVINIKGGQVCLMASAALDTRKHTTDI